MSVLAFILMVWTAVCWFSSPFDTPFLGLFIFDVDPVAPLSAAVVAAAGALILWVLRKGNEGFKRASAWLRENRLDAVLLVAIVLLTLALQLPSVLLYRGANDSDSAVLGVGGYHIADGVSRPMYRHGVHYIGSLIQHLTAPLHIVFGKSPIYLRLINTLFYCGFIIFSFILARLLIGRKTAIFSSLLAALAPYEIMVHLRHTEFAEIAFWGSLSLVVLAVMLKRERPSWRQYFWYGAVLGILFYAHPQGIHFIITGLIALFIRDKLFFIRPAFVLMPTGFVLGSIVTFIDSYYSNWIIFRVFFFEEGQAALPPLMDKIVGSVASYLGLIPKLLGLQADFTSGGLMGTPVTWIVLAAAAFCLGLFLFRYREKIAASIRFKSIDPGPAVIPILIGIVTLIFLVSRFSYPPVPMRYLFPLWLALPIILTAHLEGWRSAGGKAVGIGLVLLFAGAFAASHAIYDVKILEEEGKWARWDQFLLDNDITAFYGAFWVTYQTSFITAERVVGSASYPDWLERYRPYTRIVGASPDPPAYVFTPAIHPYHRGLADGLANKLDYLGIKYKRSEIDGMIVLHGLSERATPGQLTDLRALNEAAIAGCTVQKIVGVPGDSNPLLLTLAAVNSGETVWHADGKHGFVELLVFDGEGRELRRQPLMRDTQPGTRIDWRVLIDESEVPGGSLGLQIRLNDIVISGNKSVYRVDLNGQVLESALPARDLDALGLFSKIDGLEPPDYMFISGWGVTEEAGDRRFHWSGARSSKLGLFVRRPQPIRLILFLGPYSSRGLAKTQTVRIRCNGREIASALPLEKNRNVTLYLDERYLKRGLNVLSFAYAFTEPENQLQHRKLIYRIRPKAMVLSQIRIRRDPLRSR